MCLRGSDAHPGRCFVDGSKIRETNDWFNFRPILIFWRVLCTIRKPQRTNHLMSCGDLRPDFMRTGSLPLAETPRPHCLRQSRRHP